MVYNNRYTQLEPDSELEPEQYNRGYRKQNLSERIYDDTKQGFSNLMSGTSKFVEDNKEAVAEFGLFKIYVSVFFIILFCIFILYSGIYWFFYYDKNANGQIFELECSEYKNDKNITNYNCNFKIKFTDVESNKEYIFPRNINSTKKYTTDENIIVHYNSKDPLNEPNIDYNIYIYLGLLLIGVIGIIGSIFWVYEARRFKFVAQAEGLRAGVGLARNIFN